MLQKWWVLGLLAVVSFAFAVFAFLNGRLVIPALLILAGTGFVISATATVIKQRGGR
ncbi:MAG: hypothetical protein H0T45_16030 [Pyrinomonadaceae bacterium]|nr:hypothetical protein [Pyrinomonadaceae bacterium]